MSDAEKIKALQEMLGTMMDWAAQLSDEFLDGDPEVRTAFRKDMKAARELRAATGS